MVVNLNGDVAGRFGWGTGGGQIGPAPKHTTKPLVSCPIAGRLARKKSTEIRTILKKMFHVEHFFGAWGIGRMRLLGRVLAWQGKKREKSGSVNI